MKMIHLSLLVLGLGILLIAVSFVWPWIVGQRVWTQQQASELGEAAAEMHRLAHTRIHAEDHGEQAGEHGHNHEAGPLAGSFEEAKQRYEQSDAMLQRAQRYRWRAPQVLRSVGALCSLLGAIGYFVLLRGGSG